MIEEGLKNVAAGANPVAVRRRIEKTIAHLVKEIEAVAKPVEGGTIAPLLLIEYYL